jgi:hypothetical protein
MQRVGDERVGEAPDARRTGAACRFHARGGQRMLVDDDNLVLNMRASS